jgi:hypothetical protein
MKRAPKYKPKPIGYQMVQGPTKMERVAILPRWPAITLTSLHFGSGALCFHQDQRVWIEVGRDYLTYIYDGPDPKASKLLFTMDGDKEPWKYVALLKEN